MKILQNSLDLLAFLVMAVLLAHGFGTLAAEPCMGVADILDFSRVTVPAGIEHLSPLEAPGYYVRCEFRETPADLGAAPSSAALLAWTAKGLRFLSPAGEGFFALRQIGFLCLGLATLFLAAGLAAGLRPWLAALLLYVVVDPGYLFFFNSFYADGALFLALLGLVVWLDRLGHSPLPLLERRGAWPAAAASLALLLLLGGGSKMLFVLLPAVAALALLPLLVRLYRPNARRAALLAGLLAGIQLLVFWNFFAGPGPRFLEYNNFHAVYGGILQVSSNPDEVFARLGIPPEHRTIARTDAWTAGIAIDHPVHHSLRSLSRLELLRFYLEDPPALATALRRIADDLLLIASHPRGTYPRPESDTRPIKRIYGDDWQFSNLTRLAYARHRPVIVLLLLLPALWIALAAYRKTWNGACAALLFLLLFFVSQAALAVLGEGFVNLHQHLVGARLALDLLVVLLFVEVGTFLLRRTGDSSMGAVRRGSQ